MVVFQTDRKVDSIMRTLAELVTFVTVTTFAVVLGVVIIACEIAIPVLIVWALLKFVGVL